MMTTRAAPNFKSKFEDLVAGTAEMRVEAGGTFSAINLLAGVEDRFAGAPWDTDDPQLPQNIAPSIRGEPHFPQKLAMKASPVHWLGVLPGDHDRTLRRLRKYCNLTQCQSLTNC
jgi:hypothetical protein